MNWNDRCWVTTIYLVRDAKVLLTWNKNLQTWIPVGGHIDPGENPEIAIVREVLEETGATFEFLGDPHFENNGSVKVLKPHRIQIEKMPHHNEHINIIFFGRVKTWKDALETDEAEKLRWFSASELEHMQTEMLEPVWKCAREALRSGPHH